MSLVFSNLSTFFPMSRTTPPFSNSWLFKSIRKHHLRTLLHCVSLCNAIFVRTHFKKIAYLSPGMMPIRLDTTFKIWSQCLFYTSLSYKYGAKHSISIFQVDYLLKTMSFNLLYNDFKMFKKYPFSYQTRIT